MSTDTSLNRQPIAVVGVGALFPGSSDATGFWRDILAGTDLIRDVPESHWLLDDYYDPDPAAPDKTYARRGAFLDHVEFDALGWGVPPSTIPATDTAQLLALVVAQQVLEDAAREQFDTMDRSRISVILGVTGATELVSTMAGRLQRPNWVKGLREAGLPEDQVQFACDRIAASYVPWQEATFPGLLGNVVAGRIANRLDLGGTNCVTDAACASSLSALSMAVSELQLGNSDLVISGGVDTLNDIFMFMCFSKTPALSRTGDCRPFSDQADGTMLGEGVAMVALKRLADAERDNDRIYAVIRGVGASSDGRSKSVYAPVSAGQARALRRTYDLAGYGPDTVEFVEAHGTGTRAGDVAEFEGLRQVFDESGRSDRQWCALGSVKSQIGHTKAAAGAAGLFKAVMAVHHKVLPPTIKVSAPNPGLKLPDTPFYLSTKTRPWIRDSKHPRRASVSSFGFGGSNFHVAVEEYTGPAPRAERLTTASRGLVLLSGASASELAERARVVARSTNSLDAITRDSLGAFDVTAPARLAVVASDVPDLAAKLMAAADRVESTGEAFALPDGTAFGTGAAHGKVAFLFPGQGSHYLGMGADLAMEFDAARGLWDRAADLKMEPGMALHDVVFPRPGFGTEPELDAQRLTETQWAQPSIGCTSLAQLALLGGLGIEADMVGGHSFGEVTALFAAGALTSEADLLRIARRRGELMADAASVPGAMTALSLPISKVKELIDRHEPRVTVANHNSPTEVVVSGPTDAIASLEATLAADGITARRLSVATAFHSDIVAGSCAPFAEFLDGIDFTPARIPVYGNARAAIHENSPASLRSALVEQIVSPVRFVEMVEAMYAAGARTFVEVGPGSVLTRMVERILDGQPHLAVSVDRKGKDDVDCLMQAVARLAAVGVPMQPGGLFADHREVADAVEPPKLAVAIKGTNYGKLYPPTGGTEALPKPNPSPPLHVNGALVNGAAANGSVRQHDWAVEVTAMQPYQSQPPVAGSVPAAAVPSSGPSEWVRVFQDTQRQTADAHAVYQRAMSESYSAFLQTAEAGFAGLTTLLSGGSGAPQAIPQPPMPGVARSAIPAPVYAPTLLQAPPPVAPVMAAAPPAPANSEPPRSVVETSADVVVDWAALMLSVVADKTGYPAEMLELDMDLEADLGIDSIKRVEILAAMQDRVPEMPAVETAALASLVTLSAIVGYVQRLSGDGSAVAVAAPPRSVVETSADVVVDWAALMLSVVADKTGYPAEMLELDMDLEADLGIDSIKRVEILAAMQDRVPGMPAVETAALASLRTLAAIVEYVRGLSGEVSADPPTDASPPLPENLSRYRLELIEAKPAGLAQPNLLGGEVFVTGGGAELDEALAAELLSRGVDARATADLPDNAVACVFLGGLRDVADERDAADVNREAFRAAHRLGRTLEAGGGLFVTVQDTGGAFGLGPIDGRRAWLGGLPALAKTAGHEWPLASVKAIDLERGGRATDELARALTDELLLGGGETEVALPSRGGRFTVHAVEEPVMRGEAVIGPGDVVAVSGGARGVTAACLQAWAQECGARFLLLGRTELTAEPSFLTGIDDEAELIKALLGVARDAGESPSPAELRTQAQHIVANREIRRTLSGIMKAGGIARYEAVDVCDLPGVTAVLDRVRADWGPVAGLIHTAGVLADKMISEKTDEQFDYVFDTKVAGLRALLAATARDPLKLLCVFSSISGRSGNKGQADYAMANEVLAKVAESEHQRRPGLRVKSLAWGPWEGGMVSPALKSRFAALGVPMIPLAVGARMFADEMSAAQHGQVELVLGGRPRAEALLTDGAEAKVNELELSVGADTHSYLRGHSISGTPVLPMVLAAEWLSRAAHSFRPGLQLVALRDITVRKGVRLINFDEGGDRFALQARPSSDRSDSTLCMELRGPGGILHYSASVEELSDWLTEDGLPDIELDAWDGEPLYGDVLFHRGDFELIEELHGISDGGVSGQVRGVARAGWPGGPWLMDVAALDGALQLAVVYGHRMLGGPNLPAAIDELRYFRSGPITGRVTATAFSRKVSDMSVTTDIVLIDELGQRVAELWGVHNYALPG